MKIILEVGDKVRIKIDRNVFHTIKSVGFESFSCEVDGQLKYFSNDSIISISPATMQKAKILTLPGASAKC